MSSNSKSKNWLGKIQLLFGNKSAILYGSKA